MREREIVLSPARGTASDGANLSGQSRVAGVAGQPEVADRVVGLRDGRGPVARGPSPDSATNLSSEGGHMLFVTSYLCLPCPTFTPTEACGNSRQTLRLSSNVCSSVIKLRGAHRMASTGSTSPHPCGDTESAAAHGGSGPRSGEGLVFVPVTGWCHQRFGGACGPRRRSHTWIVPFLCLLAPPGKAQDQAASGVWRAGAISSFLQRPHPPCRSCPSQSRVVLVRN